MRCHLLQNRASARAIAAWLLGVCIGLGLYTAETCGQNPPRGNSSEVVEGMVRSLMDTRLPAPNSRRGPSQPPQAELREVRANLSGLSQEIAQLVTVLYQDVNRTPGLRPLMADALQLSAKATLLARQSASQDNLGMIADEFGDVDQSWRLLSFRLSELRGLSAQARQFAQRADQYQQRLTQLLSVAPDVDRNETIRLTTELSSELQRLMEEIDYEVTNGQQRLNLLLEGRTVYQQSRQLTTVAGQSGSLADVRREYQRFTELWNSFATKLRPLKLRFVDRQMQRVQAADRTLQELLMLPTEVDRSELIYLSQLLQRDLDELMDGVSLRDLTSLAAGRERVIVNAAELYSACNDFSECVRNGEDAETMGQVFYYLDGNWQRMASILRDAEPAAARQVYRQLDRSMRDIGEILAVQPADDGEHLDQVAAELDNLAAHLEHDMRSAIAAQSNNYSAAFRQQSLAAAQELRKAARDFNSIVVAGDRPNRVRDAAQRVVEQWNRVLPLLDRFSAVDRDHLYTIRQQIAPLVIDLQTLRVN